MKYIPLYNGLLMLLVWLMLAYERWQFNRKCKITDQKSWDDLWFNLFFAMLGISLGLAVLIGD